MAKKKPESRPPTKKPKAELLPKGYEAFLGELKERIRTAQLRASLAVNRELDAHSTGRRDATSWPVRRNTAGEPRSSTACPKTFGGNSPVSRVSRPRNLKYMRAFAQAWPDEPIVQAGCLHKLPGTTTWRLLEKVKSRPSSDSGTSARPSKTAGAETSSSTGSRATFTSVKGRPRRISSEHHLN